MISDIAVISPDSRPRAERAAQIIPHHNDYLAVIFTRGEADCWLPGLKHSPLLKMRLSVNSWHLQLDARFRGAGFFSSAACLREPLRARVKSWLANEALLLTIIEKFSLPTRVA
jgi:hypothetical protein